MKSETGSPVKLNAAYFWIAAFALFLAVAGVLYLGIFTRFLADDFCMAGDALHLGLPEMLFEWYNSWTGRFMFIIGTGLMGLGGPKFAGIGAVLAGAAWLVGLWWSALPLIRQARLPWPRLFAWLAACLFLLVLLSSIPNIFQSFYWQNGMVNYSLPLIGLTISGGIILRVWLERARVLPSSGGVFLLAFVCGGCTESFSAMQVSLFGIAILGALFAADRAMRVRLLPVLIAALLGGLASMLIVVIAPGNAIRMQAVGSLDSHPGLLRIVAFSARNMTHIFGKYFLQTPVWALASILPPFLTGWLSAAPGAIPVKSFPALLRQGWVRWSASITAAALILVTAACAPVVYAMNAYPDDRTIIIPQFVVVAAAICVSALLGAGLRQIQWLPDPVKSRLLSGLLPAGILIVALAVSGFSIWHSAKQIPDFQSFARNWDERAALIQQAVLSGQSEITVPGGDSFFGMANLSADPNNWVNQCMSGYYRLEQIIGR